MHSSPFQGFSVEFSEHRKYTPGDDPHDIDWLVYAKTDKYYIKKFEAETNITGYLVMDLSRSMGYTYRQNLTKFDYVVCLAAALCYLMIHQQDPVGLITFDEKIRNSLPPRSKRTQLGNILSLLAEAASHGQDRHRQKPNPDRRHAAASQPGDAVFRSAGRSRADLPALHRLRHRGHDVILFHVLDEAEVRFPFDGLVEFEEPESHQRVKVNADGFKAEYIKEMNRFRERYKRECIQSGVDYVPLDTRWL